jgi:AcrR family transcriptional regulator
MRRSRAHQDRAIRAVSARQRPVAEQAEVAVQTVYYVFGTKRHLLAAVVDVSIAGDVEPVGTLQRTWVDALRVEPDPSTAVERLVEATVAIVARATPIYGVVRWPAADTFYALLEENRRRRRHDQRQLIEILARSGHVPRRRRRYRRRHLLRPDERRSLPTPVPRLPVGP